MSGEVHKLPGASQAAAAGPLTPLRERGPRRGRAFERELLERGDAPTPPADARAASAPAAPRKPHADPETGGTLDVVA